MYNQWSGWETIAWAKDYVRQLIAGFDVHDADHRGYPVQVPPSKIFLGYPSTRNAASTGYIDPYELVKMVRDLAREGVVIGGLMTWSIDWDFQKGYPFARAAAGLPRNESLYATPPPTTPPPTTTPGPTVIPNITYVPGICAGISCAVTSDWGTGYVVQCTAVQDPEGNVYLMRWSWRTAAARITSFWNLLEVPFAHDAESREVQMQTKDSFFFGFEVSGGGPGSTGFDPNMFNANCSLTVSILGPRTTTTPASTDAPAVNAGPDTTRPAVTFTTFPPETLNNTGLSLVGYLCPTCITGVNVGAMVRTLPPVYSTVILAFALWDVNGHLVNLWDGNGLVLTRDLVSYLQRQGRRVILSIGGATAPPIGKESTAFVNNMASDLEGLAFGLGLDGYDWDIETCAAWSGAGALGCAETLADIMTAVLARRPGVLFSIAPQMPYVYPPLSDIQPVNNQQTPLISKHINNMWAVMPQMYNQWSGWQTIDWAIQYVHMLTTGFSVNDSEGRVYPLQIPPSKIYLGFPATRAAAGSGYQNPDDLVEMCRRLAREGVPIGGLMTWSIDKDYQMGYPFADAVSRYNEH
eukprot:m.19253 g.19253  ORF g.19253 m.19253 type:complete len:579 (+) comp3416_c0_seq2:1-1737(+)